MFLSKDGFLVLNVSAILDEICVLDGVLVLFEFCSLDEVFVLGFLL